MVQLPKTPFTLKTTTNTIAKNFVFIFCSQSEGKTSNAVKTFFDIETKEPRHLLGFNAIPNFKRS